VQVDHTLRLRHFESKPLRLPWVVEELGKRALGTPATLHFCDTLREVYGSPDPSTAAGASHGIENWAAKGF